MSKTVVSTKPMYLVYVDSGGEEHLQPWEDLTEAGTLVDPETDEDMEMIGWTTLGY